jgi:peptidoglycan hydrolase-like protein with peptidoglycan-binding domain
MQTFQAITASVILSVSALPGFTATSEGDFAVYGWGARDCSTVLAVLQGDKAAQARGQLAEWISGYITGQNRSGDGVYDLIPINSHYALVGLAQNICSKNVDQPFESIVAAIVKNFSGWSISGESPIVTLSHEGQSIDVNEATLARVQQVLVTSDLLEVAAADGKFGPQTAKALQSWQKSVGLVPSGLPDMLTLFLMAEELE